MRTLFFFLAALGAAAAESGPEPSIQYAIPFTCASLESHVLERHPILAEKAFEIEKAQEKVRDVDMGAILPKFELETGMGPAPGIRAVPDTSQYYWNNNLGLVPRTGKEFDYSEWGPFFGIEMKVVQPLNVARYRAGRRAASRNVDVATATFQKEKLEVSEEAQTFYFQSLYARTLRDALASARVDLDKAQKKMADKLDEGDESVSQTDLLQLKAGRYALDQGLNEAELGLARTRLGLRFLMGWPDNATPVFFDTSLSLRSEAIPPLDSLKVYTLRDHPDLKRLTNGLAARRELLKVAQGEMGPDIFLFASFQYSKAWSSDRQSGGKDPFAVDPLNELTGVAGLGVRLQLNFWQRYQKYRKERLELRQLQRTEVYAARGLLLQTEDAYVRLLKAKADAEDAQKAMRAAEAWLKGAAMKADLDASENGALVSPFRNSLTAKRDYYKAVLEYDLSVTRLFKTVGWTLSDALGNLRPVTN